MPLGYRNQECIGRLGLPINRGCVYMLGFAACLPVLFSEFSSMITMLLITCCNQQHTPALDVSLLCVGVHAGSGSNGICGCGFVCSCCPAERATPTHSPGPSPGSLLPCTLLPKLPVKSYPDVRSVQNHLKCHVILSMATLLSSSML